jgi:hypothetical protein
MPYRKSKKVSKRRNKARTKRFRKSKRKTKYHKKKYVGGMFGFLTENPMGRALGLDAVSQQKKREVAGCKKQQDDIIKAAQEAKKNCSKNPSGPENDNVNLQPNPLNQNQPEMTDGQPSPDLPPVPQQGPLPPNGGKKKKSRRKNKKNTNKKYK